jgi:hypothetical protein
MELRLAIEGNLIEYFKKETATIGRSLRSAMDATSDGLKRELRVQVRGAGLGAQLANTWRSVSHPTNKNVLTLSPAAQVFSRAPVIISAFDRGVIIRSTKGAKRFLAIPTENAPKRGVNGKIISPANWPEASYGPLRAVHPPGRFSFLVVDDQRVRRGKRGGFTLASEKARAKGRGLVSVVMFVLVPQVTLRKRLNVQAAIRRWEAALPRIATSALARDLGK